MHGIACQLVLKWARQGSSNRLNVLDDFTRVSLDTIALCAMNMRFDSFYSDALHPFVGAITYFLGESGRRATRPAFVSNYIYRAATRQYWESIQEMKDIAQQAIDERRRNPVAKRDLMNAMLYEKDPKSGKQMTDLSVIQNAITFLGAGKYQDLFLEIWLIGAGHETTTGMLSFLFALFLKHPQTLKVAQEEVDSVAGSGPVAVEHMNRMPYITACLREVLRLYPSAPGFQVVPKAQTFPIFIGINHYQINKGDILRANLPKIHRDPLVYGADSHDFRPERMLDESFNNLPPNSWKVRCPSSKHNNL